MKKRLLLLCCCLGAVLSLSAQGMKRSSLDSLMKIVQQQVNNIDTSPHQPQTEADTLFSGTFRNDETGLIIHLDLNKERLLTPSLEFLGPVHGYLTGGVYGVWMLVRHEVKADHVLLYFSNDLGSDTQAIKLSRNKEQLFVYEVLEGNKLKKAIGRRLVKFHDSLPLRKISKY